MRHALPNSRQSGMTLIEVLIALVVVGIGVMGLALMQVVNLRYTQGANQRTQAVNLAGELIDMMRSNRSQLGAYAMSRQSVSDVAAADVKNGCATAGKAAETGTLDAAANVKRWKCEIRETLGADAYVQVDADASTGVVEVTVEWGEDNLQNKITGDRKVALDSVL